ncbi:MAG TPA: phytanoyl-CoA dioxygenase family protein [Pirellulales bacterium]|nr:phytanoyl-CoA dioxygenase family protein [Pirellulales bacterium]
MDPKKSFERDGYVFVPGLLAPQEAAKYRAEIQKLSGVGDADFRDKLFECPDGVSKNRAFWPVIFNQKLLATLRQILGPTVRYTQHSDLHAHRTGGWHRDCACRNYGQGPDWTPSAHPYHVVRVAIYLQSYAESGSSLGIIPGSHRPQRPLPRFGIRAWSKYLRTMRQLRGNSEEDQRRDKDFPWIQTVDHGLPLIGWPALPVWFRTEPGDAVIFDQRCYHCASDITGPKYAIYLSYSPDDEHASNHLYYYTHVRRDLKYGQLDPELVEQLKQAGLYCEPHFKPEQEAILREFCHAPVAGSY